jgi:hypothetical protein
LTHFPKPLPLYGFQKQHFSFAATKGRCLILQTLLFDILNTLRCQMGVEIGGVRTSKEQDFWVKP